MKGIIHDKDGSLTNLGPNTYASAYFKHLEQPECRVDKDVYDGVICDNTVQIRRVSFYAAAPANTFYGMSMYVLPYDDAVLNGFTAIAKEQYIANKNNYGKVIFTDKAAVGPGSSVTIAVVTGHKYRIQWTDNSALDWMKLKI